jgi:hypothetical protein
MLVQFFQDNLSIKLDYTLCPFGIKQRSSPSFEPKISYTNSLSVYHQLKEAVRITPSAN